MDDLGHADRGEVAIALVGENDQVRPRTLDAGGYSRRATVCRLLKVYVEVVVSKHRASDRRNTDGSLTHPELVEYLGHQPVDCTVGATGAVMGGDVRQ